MTNVVITEQEKIRRLIKEAGLSRSQLAKELGVSYRTVLRWIDKGVVPHPDHARDIDELFKDYIDISFLVEKIKKEITNPIRLLKRDKALQEKFFLLMTYHSNAIEGSRMTIKETEAAISGKKVRGKEMFEHFEAINHHNALIYMLENIRPGFRITEEYILKLHSIVMYNFNNKLPGKYRTGYVNLTNTEKKLPSFQRVPFEMKKLIRRINNYGKTPIKQIALEHHELECIHPFFDGNGRVGRLLMLTQLLSRGYPPAIIEIKDRYKYYLALGKADMGDYRNIVQMVCESILNGYNLLFN